MFGDPLIEENYITPSQISNYNKAETLRDHSRSSPCHMSNSRAGAGCLWPQGGPTPSPGLRDRQEVNWGYRTLDPLSYDRGFPDAECSAQLQTWTPQQILDEGIIMAKDELGLCISVDMGLYFLLISPDVLMPCIHPSLHLTFPLH